MVVTSVFVRTTGGILRSQSTEREFLAQSAGFSSCTGAAYDNRAN